MKNEGIFRILGVAVLCGVFFGSTVVLEAKSKVKDTEKSDGDSKVVKADDNAAKEGCKKEKHGEKKGKWKEFAAGQKRACKEFAEKCRESRKAFNESVKDATPAERCTKLAAFVESNAKEKSEFCEAEFAKRIAFMKSMAGEGEDARAGLDERIDKATQRHKTEIEMRAHHVSEKVALLKELGAKTDLTEKDMKSALKELRKKQAGERKESCGKGKCGFGEGKKGRKHGDKASHEKSKDSGDDKDQDKDAKAGE